MASGRVPNTNIIFFFIMFLRLIHKIIIGNGLSCLNYHHDLDVLHKHNIYRIFHN